MKKLLIVLPGILFTIAACSGGASPTSPGGNGGNGGGGGGGGGGGASTSTVDTITLNATSFSPANLTVAAGRTVVWFNPGTGVHTVTPDGHTAWTTASTSTRGEVMRMTFSAAGEFNYFCEPHLSLGMTGRVTVTGS